MNEVKHWEYCHIDIDSSNIEDIKAMVTVMEICSCRPSHLDEEMVCGLGVCIHCEGVLWLHRNPDLSNVELLKVQSLITKMSMDDMMGGTGFDL